MKELYRQGNFRFLEYTPTLFRPLFIDFEPMSFVRRVRLLLEYLGTGHYKVFYLEKNGDLIGHCVVAPGGRRLKCTTINDIVLGPYFIKHAERGHGYSEKLIKFVLGYVDFQYAYDWVEKNNIASCKASQACGFMIVGELNVSSIVRKLSIVPKGENYIFRFQKEEKNSRM